MSARSILNYKAQIALIAALVALASMAAMGGITGNGLLAVVLVQPINALSLVCMALRTRALSNSEIGFGAAFKGGALSTALLYVLPSRLSEFVKPLYLSEKCGLPFTRGLALVAVERFIDIGVVTLGLGLGSLLIARKEFEFALAVWGSVALFGILLAVVMLRWPKLLERIMAILPWQSLRRSVTLLVAETRTLFAPSRLALAGLWAVATWILSFLTVYLLLKFAGGVPLSLSATFLVFLAGTVGIALAVAPGGLGTFEAAIVVALNLQGYSIGEALALSLLLRAANLGFTPIIAAWTLARDGIGLAGLVEKLWKMRQSPASEDQTKGKDGTGPAS